MSILLQDVPNYCLMGTIFILCLDRHRRIKTPEKACIPIKWALGIVWVLSLAFVLPYSAYITFIDLSVSAKNFIALMPIPSLIRGQAIYRPTYPFCTALSHQFRQTVLANEPKSDET